MQRRRALSAPIAAVLLVAFGPAPALGDCVQPFGPTGLVAVGTPPGDLNASGDVDVVDVQCAILTTLWKLGGKAGDAPACLAGPVVLADVQCDGTVDVVDVVQLIITALGQPLGPGIDADGDGCPDNCAAPTVRHGFATITDGTSSGGGFVLRQAPVVPASVGAASGGDFHLTTRTFGRIAGEGSTP